MGEIQRRIVIGAGLCIAAFALVGIRLVDVTLMRGYGGSTIAADRSGHHAYDLNTHVEPVSVDEANSVGVRCGQFQKPATQMRPHLRGGGGGMREGRGWISRREEWWDDGKACAKT